MNRIPALLVCACTVAATILPTASAAADAGREAIESLNQVRRAHGLRALHPSKRLTRSSARWARRMIRRDFFAHGMQIGVGSRRFWSAGETIAWHSGWKARPRRTVHRWLASPGHRAVLLSASFRRVGIGYARGRLGSRIATTWVAHVAAP